MKMRDQKDHFRFDYIRSYFTFSIIEKVRNTVQTRKKLREVYEESVYQRYVSVKTDFRNFVPMISTLKMRHVLDSHRLKPMKTK